jgi:phosphohistidine phosphatase SixA
MSNIYMVRHGEAAAGFDPHIDPGLSKLGKDQASATAKELDAMGPMQIVTSSLGRDSRLSGCREYSKAVGPAYKELTFQDTVLPSQGSILNVRKSSRLAFRESPTPHRGAFP